MSVNESCSLSGESVALSTEDVKRNAIVDLAVISELRNTNSYRDSAANNLVEKTLNRLI